MRLQKPIFSKLASYRHYCLCPRTQLKESCQGWPTLSVRLRSRSCPGENQKVSNASPTSPGSHIKATRISRISRMHAHKHAALLNTLQVTRWEFTSVLATLMNCQHQTYTCGFVSAHSEPCQGTVACLFISHHLQKNRTHPASRHEQGNLILASENCSRKFISYTPKLFHSSCPLHNIPDNNPEKWNPLLASPPTLFR